MTNEIKMFSLANESGAEVLLSNLGAGIVSIIVPDRNGKLADVVLGYRNPEDYLADGPCMGKIPGRFANRIAKGLFSIGGRQYKLSINNGPNHLHGGPGAESFANRIWDAEEVSDGVKFTLDSPDGDAGYPGTLHVEVLYSWSEDNVLKIAITARSDSETVVNLTNHAYFNLKGEEKGNVKDHMLQLRCSRFLMTDENLIPTGEMTPVSGTPMDFTEFKSIGKDIDADYPALKFGKGYDNCFVVDGYAKGKIQQVACLKEPQSGRALTVHTDAPGIQVYTGNWLSGSPVSKSGREYADYDGVALECQYLPDSPNQPGFPFETLKPGAEYHNTILFEFSC